MACVGRVCRGDLGEEPGADASCFDVTGLFEPLHPRVISAVSDPLHERPSSSRTPKAAELAKYSTASGER